MTFEKLLDDLTFDYITIKEAYKQVTSKEKLKLINYYVNRDKISKEDLKDGELNQLNAIVGVLQILYNSSIGSPIKDDHYDTLQEMLIDLGIPRLTGSVEINSANKVSHRFPNLRGTLSKCYYLFPDDKRTNKSRKYLDEWKKQQEARYLKNTKKKIDLDEQKVILFPKFDGVSCVLESFDRKTWLTRGETGRINKASDVSHVMDIFNDLYGEYGTGVKFEVMVTEENKDKINKLYRNRNYKNSRQVVTATFNSDEPDFKADYLYPIPLRIMKEGDEIEQIHPLLLEKFPHLICKLSERDKIKEFARENKWVLLNGMRFRTDGVVITLLDPNVQKALGRENDLNNFEVAYKFAEETAYTKVRDVEFYVSEFGFITPVLVVTPVILKGNTVDHISLSNKERFDELYFSYGDDVKVLYDIIPYATRDEKCQRVKKGRKIEFVKRCPKCGSELEFKELRLNPETKEMEMMDKVQIQCENLNCPSRFIGRILNYCTNLRIQNIGYSTLEQLYNAGLLKKGIRSLYKLKKKTPEIMELEGFGKLKTRKIIAEIEAKRRLKDYEFFGSIGIESLSIKTFQAIFAQIRYIDFMNMIKTKNFELMLAKLMTVDGIGEIKAELLVAYLRDTTSRIEVQQLIEELSIFESYGEKASSKGKIVISGFRSNEFVDLMTNRGWEVSDSWNNKARVLVVDRLDNESTEKKQDKARKIKVPICTREEAERPGFLEKLMKGE